MHFYCVTTVRKVKKKREKKRIALRAILKDE